MNVTISLSDDFRREQFKATGREHPYGVELEVRGEELPDDVREKIVAVFGPPPWRKIGLTRLDEQSCGEANNWDCPLLPETPDAWAEVFRAYFRAREERRDAEVAEKRKRFDEILSDLRKYALLDDAALLRSTAVNGPLYAVNRNIHGEAVAAEELEEARGIAAAIAERIKAERDRDEAERRAEQAREEAEERAAREKEEAEKAAWIAAHGSDYLKKAHGEGYDCQRLYATERAALEFPGFAVDFDDAARFKERTCPSEKALDESIRIGGPDKVARVVWLKRPIAYRPDEDPDLGYEFEPREAVVIGEFLGRYDLIKEI